MSCDGSLASRSNVNISCLTPYDFRTSTPRHGIPFSSSQSAAIRSSVFGYQLFSIPSWCIVCLKNRNAPDPRIAFSNSSRISASSIERENESMISHSLISKPTRAQQGRRSHAAVQRRRGRERHDRLFDLTEMNVGVDWCQRRRQR